MKKLAIVCGFLAKRLLMVILFVASFFFSTIVSASAAITGEWTGTVTCSRNKNMDIRLLITIRGSGLAATMETKISRRFLGKIWPHKLVGRYEAGKGGYLFVPVYRSRGPQGLSKGFMFFPAKKGRTARGEVLNDRCRSFSVERITANSSSRRLSVRQPSNGGSYFAASGLQDRCEAILNWAQRIDKEFPGFSMRHNTLTNIYRKAILLYADNSFVPVFGQSFERIDAKRLRAVWDEQRSNCSKDPFLRQRGGWVWHHSIFNPLRVSKKYYYAGAFPKASIVQHIRKIRRVHNEVKIPRHTAGRDYLARIRHLEGIEKEISRNDSLFWPSEQLFYVSLANQKIHRLAMAQAKKVLLKLARIRDPNEGLRLVRKSLSSDQDNFLIHINGSQRAAVRRKISGYRDEFSGRLEGPIIGKMDSAPRTITGANLLHRIATGRYPSINQMSYQERLKIKARAIARRDQILKAEISADLDRLGNYPGGHIGLAASTKWMKVFSAKYKVFARLKLVKQARGHFVEDRSVRLREAFSDFESSLAKIRPGARGAEARAREVMSRYVSWQGDRQLPEYFLYSEALSAYK